MQLPIGTRVRILSGCYKGRIGYIVDDNSFDIWLAQKCGGIVPPYYYHYYVVTSDGEDIEHGHAEPHELRIVSR